MSDQIVGIFVGATFGMVVGILITVSNSQISIRKIEARLNLLLRHAGIDAEAAAMAEVSVHVRAGNRLEGIKTMRELTGCGLAAAKVRVDTMMNESRTR